MGKIRTANREIDLTNANDPVVAEAIQLLWLSPQNKKEIANQTNLQLGQIHRIYQIHFAGGRRKPPININTVGIDTAKEDQKPATEEKKEEVVEIKKNGWSRKKIDDDVILSICSDIENGMTKEDVAKKYNVSEATVYKYCTKMGVEIKHHVTKEEPKSEPKIERTVAKVVEEVEEKIVSKKTTGMPFKKVSSTDAVIKAMLINERHSFPCQKFIMDVIPQDKLFDFDYYNHTMESWINTNIPKKDGVWLKSIECYATGLQAAGIALCKVCGELKVNLKFLHYNRDTQAYEPQVVYEDFEVVNKNYAGVLGGIFCDGTDLFLHDGVDVNKLDTIKSVFCVIRRIYDKSATEAGDGRVKTYIAERYVFASYEDTFSCIPNIITSNNKANQPAVISLNEMNRIAGTTYWNISDPILKSQNAAFNKVVAERDKGRK